MSYRPGDTFYVSFITVSSAGAAVDADALPSAVLRRNGVVDSAVTVSVAHNATGDYTASATIPLVYSGGDDLELVFSATISSVSTKQVRSLLKLDRTAQTVAQVIHRAGQVHFIAPGGDASRDGLSPQTAKALPTQPTPAAGDTILLLSGTFALGAATLDLSGDGVTGVHLIGAGMGATIVTGTALLTSAGCMVKPGNGSQIVDLTIRGIAADGGTTNQYQAPLGAALTQTAFTDALARRVQLRGDSDGIYMKKTGSTLSLRAYDCLIQTKYDTTFLNCSADSRLELYDCHLIVIGPSTCNGGTIARSLSAANGTIQMYGGTLSAINGTANTWTAQAAASGVLNLHRVDMAAGSSSGTVFSLDNSGQGITIFDCAYNPAQTNGTITTQPIPATLAPSQAFDNTGQTTPQPATTAFGGANAVALAFRDSLGNPVGGVIFTIQGFGTAVADAGGNATISLPNGTFTVTAMPIAGTLWPPSSITVAGSGTFTIMGTTASIPSPSDPGQTTAYLTTRDGHGNPQPGITLSFQLVDPQAATDSFDQTTFVATSDGSASLQVTLLKKTKYQGRVGNGPWVSFTTGVGATYALPEILGTY